MKYITTVSLDEFYQNPLYKQLLVDTNYMVQTIGNIVQIFLKGGESYGYNNSAS